jgi:hypothetical protein
MKQGDRLFDTVDIGKIPDREFVVLNALDVSIHRSLEKYEFVYQVIDQNRTEMNRNVVLVCWELVDWVERSRKILGYGTGLKKKEPEYILAYRALAKGEEFRHSLQHFDKFIQESLKHDFSPLGAVTALKYVDANNLEFCSYVPGILRENKWLGSTDLNVQMKDKVDHVTLEFHEQKLNLSEISRALLRYYEFLRSEVTNRYEKT